MKYNVGDKVKIIGHFDIRGGKSFKGSKNLPINSTSVIIRTYIGWYHDTCAYLLQGDNDYIYWEKELVPLEESPISIF